jgi:hypothetical protein
VNRFDVSHDRAVIFPFTSAVDGVAIIHVNATAVVNVYVLDDAARAVYEAGEEPTAIVESRDQVTHVLSVDRPPPEWFLVIENASTADVSGQFNVVVAPRVPVGTMPSWGDPRFVFGDPRLPWGGKR